MMRVNEKANNQEKKIFLKWLTNNYQFEVREALWILDFLYNHQTILKKSHFVEKVEQTPRGIYISVSDLDKVDFVLYKNGHSYNNPMKAFHEVRLNWSSDLYLEIDFENAWQSKEYLAVLEDNPYAPWNEAITDELIIEMKNALKVESYIQAKKRLVRKIDEALAVEDQENFIELSRKFEQLEEEMNDCQLEK